MESEFVADPALHLSHRERSRIRAEQSEARAGEDCEPCRRIVTPPHPRLRADTRNLTSPRWGEVSSGTTVRRPRGSASGVASPSPPLELGAISTSVSACWRLSARATVCRVSGEASGAERGLEQRLGLGGRRRRARRAVGDVEALRQAVDPGGLLVGIAVRRRRTPQRLAEQACASSGRRGLGRNAERAPGRDQPLARPLELLRRRRPRPRAPRSAPWRSP